jgi:hypothetical protein
MFGSWRPKIEIDPSYVMIKFGTGRVLVGSFSLSIFVIKLTLQSFPLTSFTISRVGEVFTLKLAYNWMHSQVREVFFFLRQVREVLNLMFDKIWLSFLLKVVQVPWQVARDWRNKDMPLDLRRSYSFRIVRISQSFGARSLSPHFGVSSLVLVYIDCMIRTYLLQT